MVRSVPDPTLSRAPHTCGSKPHTILFSLNNNPMVTIVSPAELNDLATQVDKRLPKDLAFFRYGDRMLQIKRYLIEHELDVSQAVMAIKRTAVWRKAWNADTIKPSDLKEIATFARFVSMKANADGLSVACAQFNPPLTGEFPRLEKVIEFFIFAMDYMLKTTLETCRENHIEPPVKDYGKIILNAAAFSPAFVRQAFPLYPKTVMEILLCHYPCFLSVSDIYISDDPNFVPDTGINSHTAYFQNAPVMMKGLFSILKGFFPERWARQICMNTDLFVPPCLDINLVPKQNGGNSDMTPELFLEEMAKEMNCSMEVETTHELSERVLEMYGHGNSVPACNMPNAYARASMWKMTNAGGRWHHYYFVLTRDNILYYFTSADDTQVRTGL